MKITVVQPPYFAGEKPDGKIADFLMNELQKVEKDSLIVLPEYSNAGGVSDIESEKAALPRAKEMLKVAATIAKENAAYIAINVLEDRNEKIKNSTYLFDKKGNIAFIYDKIHLPPSEIASDEKGGCSMIVAPDGKILKDMGKSTGAISTNIDPKEKHMRTAGFGGGMIRNDDFINNGLRPDIFRK